MGKISDALDKIEVEQELSKFPKSSYNADSNTSMKSDTAVRPEVPLNSEIPIREVELPKEDNERAILKTDMHENLIAIHRPQSFEAEQIRMLRSQLLFPKSGIPPKSILVTSTEPGEGKSFVSSNLAISIAQSINDYVLLMDCDMRKPSINKYFGFGEMPGLSEYLSTDVPLASLLYKTNINKLTILPGGKTPRNPSELLSSKKMAQLTEELKSRYADRFLVIDSPPPTLTSETKILANLIDGAIIVVRSRKTQRKYVSDLVQLLGKERILGIVVNMCDIKANSDGYHRFGKYYESYKD